MSRRNGPVAVVEEVDVVVDEEEEEKLNRLQDYLRSNLLDRIIKSKVVKDEIGVENEIRVESIAEGRDSIVEFRLFSHNKLQKIELNDQAQVNDVVLDPRIRDLTLLSKSEQKVRKKQILSIVIDSSTILKQSQEIVQRSRYSKRITSRKLKPGNHNHSSSNLAYINSSKLLVDIKNNNNQGTYVNVRDILMEKKKPILKQVKRLSKIRRMKKKLI